MSFCWMCLNMRSVGPKGSYFWYVSFSWKVFLVFIRSMWLFCDAPHTNWGTGLHCGPQKENSNWCDWSRVRVHRVMKWHGLYQSVSHPVTTVVPECSLPLRRASLLSALALPLGNSCSLHPPHLCLFALLCQLLSQLLQAVPFQSIISSPPSLALWEV